MRKQASLLGFLLPLLCLFARASLAAAPLEFDRVDGQTLRFKSADGATKSLKTTMSDLSYIGTLHSNEGENYFLLSGKETDDPAADKAIFVFRPSAGRMTSFVYPGRVIDPKRRGTVLEARAFYGKCLDRSAEDQYMVFQKERIDRRRALQPSVFIAEPGPDHLNERLIERHLPNINRTLKRVRARLCHEIEGRNRILTKRPMAVTTHNRAADAQDDDDDDAPGASAPAVPAPTK